MGNQQFLDQIDAEIVEVTNSKITCRGGNSAEGGSMIDDFIMSKVLIGLIHSILVDSSTEWSPHYGIELKLYADVLAVTNLVLMQPSLPGVLIFCAILLPCCASEF